MVINYKCPNCGSAMVYDEDTQMLKCNHCGMTQSIEEYQKNNSDNVNDSNDTVHLVKYHCPDCGAEILADEDTAATFCSFCGNPTLINDRLVGEKKPSKIIPFKINKNQAMEQFKKWTGSGILTPPGFRSSHTVEKLQGIYVPYWLYDYHTDVHMSADATKTRTTRSGNTEYIYTDHFAIERDVAVDFDRIPADASEHMPDDVMERLEPFLYDDLVDFEMPYLSGFLAEKYHYLSKDLRNIVEERVKNYGESLTRDTINGYDSVRVTNAHSNLQEKMTEYVLMPVWMLIYRYKEKNYTFALNGQTGRLVGTRPISKGRVVLVWFALTLIFFVLISIFGGVFL